MPNTGVSGATPHAELVHHVSCHSQVMTTAVLSHAGAIAKHKFACLTASL